MQKNAVGIPSELFVGYLDSEDISDDELYRMTDRELGKPGMIRFEVSPDNFSEEELARLEALEAEGYSPSYIFNTGLEAVDRTHAHEIKEIFTTGLAKLETSNRFR